MEGVSGDGGLRGQARQQIKILLVQEVVEVQLIFEPRPTLLSLD